MEHRSENPQYTTAAPGYLTEATFARGLRWLADRDADLARILDHLGPPPLWARDAGFPSLVHIILEQQVSLASARAAYDRLLAAAAPLTPARFLELDHALLKHIGFSRQKAAYVRHLAHEIVTGRFDLAQIEQLDDIRARAELVKLKGIGCWTADVYLLMALRRPDSWPSGDLALAEGARQAKGLSTRPTPSQLDQLAAPWQPWRAVAARMLWHLYLSKNRKA